MKKTFIQVCRKIVEKKQSARFNGLRVDLFSASAVILVYDKLNPENKAKLESKHPVQIVEICFKMIEVGKK